MSELQGPLVEHFTSWHLGRIAERLEAEAAQHKDAPAATALRAACVAVLPVDQRRPEPWDDPTFLPRFLRLREVVAYADGRSLPLADAVGPFREFVAYLESLEAPDQPF